MKSSTRRGGNVCGCVPRTIAMADSGDWTRARPHRLPTQHRSTRRSRRPNVVTCKGDARHRSSPSATWSGTGGTRFTRLGRCFHCLTPGHSQKFCATAVAACGKYGHVDAVCPKTPTGVSGYVRAPAPAPAADASVGAAWGQKVRDRSSVTTDQADPSDMLTVGAFHYSDVAGRRVPPPPPRRPAGRRAVLPGSGTSPPSSRRPRPGTS